MAETGTYLYGVARDLGPDAVRDLSGVAGASVRTVHYEGLVALVSTVSLDEFGEEALRDNFEDLDWLEKVARAHHDVIDAASALAPTAPMRLATIYHGDERVSSLLESRGDEFVAALSRVSGRVEWGVKAYADPGTFARARADTAGQSRGADADAGQGASAGTASTASPGTAYLVKRRAQQESRQESWRGAAARGEDIDADLREIAEDARRHPPQDPRLSGHGGWMILNGAYLVDAGRDEEFRSAFARVAERYPEIELELTGPWAPYSFAEGHP